MRRPLWIACIALTVGCPEPIPEVRPLECAPGEIIDGVSCVPEECGAGSIFGDLTELDAVFVAPAPEGSEDGDGSMERPFARIDAGIDEAFVQGKDVVAVSAGQFPESVGFGRTGAVRVTGRCPQMTVIDGERGGLPGVVVQAAGAQLTDLTVLNATPGIAVLPADSDASASLSAVNVRLVGNRVSGIVVSGREASLDLRETFIDATEPTSPTGNAQAVLVEGGATASLVQLSLASQTADGVVVAGEGSRAEIDGLDATLLPRFPGGGPTSTLVARGGGTLMGEAVLHRAGSGRYAYATGVGSLIQTERREMSGDEAAPPEGAAVHADDGARIALSDVDLWGGPDGLALASGGGQLQLEDVRLRASGSMTAAPTLHVEDLGFVSLIRAEFSRDETASVVVEGGGELQCDACSFTGSRGPGVVVRPGGVVVLQEGSVRLLDDSTRTPTDTPTAGLGVLVEGHPDAPPRLEMYRTRLNALTGPAVVIQGQATVLLSEVVIEDTNRATRLPFAAVLARDGVPTWMGAVGVPGAVGLWIRDAHFDGLPGDAILLDDSSARLENNTFGAVGAAELRLQNCGTAEPPTYLGAQPRTVDCVDPVPLGPPLTYAR